MIKKILILGGGSGGVRCALNLEKKLKDKVLAGQAWLKYQFSVNLSRELLAGLEEYSNWHIDNKIGDVRAISDFSDLIYFESLGEIKPGAFSPNN